MKQDLAETDAIDRRDRGLERASEIDREGDFAHEAAEAETSGVGLVVGTEGAQIASRHRATLQRKGDRALTRWSRRRTHLRAMRPSSSNSSSSQQ